VKHFVIPDCQIRPGDDVQFLRKIGQYIVEKKPDVIVNIGDFADMPSLSSYDVGKKAYEGRRYLNDVQSVHVAMQELLLPIAEYNYQQKRNGKKQYKPRLVLTLGNHENRINRAVNNDPKLEGILSVDDLHYRLYGWEVYDFLDVVVVDGIAYSHYFVTGVAGRAASSAAAQFRKTNMSCVAGHQQGLQIATASRADGARLTSIIAGSCYEHDEDYLGPQGNKHWRGCLMLHEVQNGQFDLMPVSLEYLNKKY
jgi:Calcineurin-like phosphoesterase